MTTEFKPEGVIKLDLKVNATGRQNNFTDILKKEKFAHNAEISFKKKKKTAKKCSAFY